MVTAVFPLILGIQGSKSTCSRATTFTRSKHKCLACAFQLQRPLLALCAASITVVAAVGLGGSITGDEDRAGWWVLQACGVELPMYH